MFPNEATECNIFYWMMEIKTHVFTMSFSSTMTKIFSFPLFKYENLFSFRKYLYALWYIGLKYRYIKNVLLYIFGCVGVLRAIYCVYHWYVNTLITIYFYKLNYIVCTEQCSLENIVLIIYQWKL